MTTFQVLQWLLEGKLYMKKITVMLLAFFILLILNPNIEAKSNEQKSFVDEINSKSLKSTRITPVMDTNIITGENLIFCSTFQMAWNELCNKYAMDTLEIEKAPEYAEKLNVLYKQQPLLNEDSYLAMSGKAEDDILNKINEAVRKKIRHLNKDELLPKFSFPLKPRDIVVFSYLYKNIEFEKPFDITKPVSMLYKHKIFHADTFGFDENSKEDYFAKQFRLLYYKKRNQNNSEPNEIVISLTSKSVADEIIISTLPAGKTIKESYDNIVKAINSNTNFIPRVAELRIPKLDFNILHEYDDLTDKKIFNKLFKNYYIKKAIQKIAFNLNEKGSKVISDIIIVREACFYLPIIINIKCPFIIYLKDITKDAPYFMAYVATPELFMENKTTDSSDKFGKLDAEIELNPLLQRFCRNFEPVKHLNLDLNYINAENEDGSNTLLLALKKKIYIETRILINFKDEYDGKKSEYEKTSLKVKKEHFYELIKYLIKYGGKVNSSDNLGLTPLMCAVEDGDYEIVKLLVESGADINAKRKDKKDALKIAQEKKNDKIIKFLSEKLKQLK